MKSMAPIIALGLIVFLFGCGGGGQSNSTPPPTPSVTISTSNSAVAVTAGASQTFTATVTGTTNTAVAWSIQEGSAGGTIDAGGKYTAPSTAGTFHIVATSMADPTKTAVITVAVTASVSVTVSPASATVPTTSSQQFTATVSGTSNTGVTWSVQEAPTGGTIDASGKYTAPGKAGTFHVVARSVADSTKSAIATVTVTQASVSITVSPASTTMMYGTTQQFTATVTGTSNTAVLWFIQDSSNGSKIDQTGKYTAPTVLGTYHVVAVSQADDSKSATATVTITAPKPLTYTLALFTPTYTALAGHAEDLNVTVVPFDPASPVSVDWEVQEATGGGSIAGTSSAFPTSPGVFSGTYHAPGTPGVYHVIARLHENPNVSLTIPVTVSGSPVPIWMNANIGGFCSGGLMRQVSSAYVGADVHLNDGTTRLNDVSWTIQEGAAGGTIVQSGFGPSGEPLSVYTAGATLGTFHLIATANGDHAISATMTVKVIPLVFNVLPASDTLGASGKRTMQVRTLQAPPVDLGNGTFGNLCTGSDYVPPLAVSVAEGSNGGTIRQLTEGFSVRADISYTAPPQTGTYHLTVAARDLPSVNVPVTFTVVNSGYFTSAGPFTGGSGDSRAARVALNDGSILVAGGGNGFVGFPLSPFAVTQAGILHPAADGSVTFTKLPSLNVARASAGAVLLKDGRVLIAGGEIPLGSSLASAELFNPATATFTMTGSMHVGRTIDFASLLSDGRAILGGLGFDRATPASAEIYDPTAGVFGDVIGLPHPSFSGSAMLPNGKILLIGGNPLAGTDLNGNLEVFDPLTRSSVSVGSLEVPRWNECTAVLQDGTVLIAGGRLDFATMDMTSSAEIVDPTKGTVTRVGNMTKARAYHSCTLMANGKVLITGGSDGGGGTSADLYDPATRSFTATGGREFYLGSTTGFPLLNGMVLVTDGYPLDGVDVYHP